MGCRERTCTRAASRRSRAAGPTPGTTWRWARRCSPRCWDDGRRHGVARRGAAARAVTGARGGSGERFPGFDVVAQAGRWDPVTADAVLARLGRRAEPRFFTPAEQAAAAALLDQLLGQQDGPEVPLLHMVDARLAARETDGWRYACTAFYSHPLAWNEIGFPGPAYPRGYKNPGVDALEPFEVRDALPGLDPVRQGA